MSTFFKLITISAINSTVNNQYLNSNNIGSNLLRCLFIIPIIYLIFAIVTLVINDIDNRNMMKIKRIYYALWLLGIVIIINNVNLSLITVSNTYGIPQILWIGFFIFVIGIAVAIVLDMLIISGTNIKEITLGWAKISKDEIKQNIEKQDMNVETLLNKIEAEFEVIQNLNKYFTDNNIENKLRTNYSHFPWEDEFRLIIQFYCNYQKTNLEAIVLNATNSNFQMELQTTFNITSTNLNKILKNNNDNKSTPITQKDSFLFIPYKPVFYNNKIIIILRGKPDFVFEIEQRIVLNIIKLFENYSTDILASIPNNTVGSANN